MINRFQKLPKSNTFFLFGPRQTGKSTLIKNTFSHEKCYWYDLLQTDTYTRLAAHPELFREEVLARKPKITHVIIDEVQRIPELLNEVHFLSEQPGSPFFVLTGSSARKLRAGKANLLAGRALTFHLFPLTLQELGDQFSLSKVLRFGSLPRIFLEKTEEDASKRLRAYVDTYLKEEIQFEANVRNLPPFLQFLSLAAEENGHQISYSNMARETGVSYQAIKGFFQILEDTLIGQMLYPYSKSVRKRLSKHPKFYFFDLGVKRALARKLNVPLERHTKEFGEAFEHFLILEMLRLATYKTSDYIFSFYRTLAGAEVDLIIETPQGRTIALEIKTTATPSAKDCAGLRSFLEICPKAELFIASFTPHRRKIGNVTILPWQEVSEVLGLLNE